ncbi:hypothetical protein AGRA3207_004047 [Actinomadura graeca]|uniref:Uncharacterized protein n=1 Tax=Actinomadura graeca TaxID=2750812 RepID=A0ABX8QXA4_9ACTN|nr:hypothetical protein [Actinomadura graeca]QXJ22961.1 hypothetical protein AGRA3207_004047 [Actinomadura graeca]
MSETPNDPAGSTHQFQTFANQAQSDKSSGPSMALIVGVVAVVAIVAVLVIGLMMM